MKKTLLSFLTIAAVALQANAADLPTTGNVIAEYYTGNGQTFGGWGGSSKFENVDEDGKPCLKFTNEEATEYDWNVQMAIDYDFEPGTTYYIGFDIKGTPAEGITSAFQAKENYAGCGNLTNFDITADWKHVIIYGEPFDAGENGVSNPPMRWLANLGKYVGTFYLTNLTIYTEKSSGVEAVAPVENGRTVVFNLQGIKVLDTDNKAEVYDLPAGIYIVNGKKIAVK
ncbi:hypothetical protein [Lepagella muris]|uniref:Uncharacterized protein n=1 Tax=Lepagella muris TaxID=3032870 RepID=A0AC61RF01_9BACT|nr:hypothetical protein [Lepagella muris]TGY78227.1 hypothetical protein E5331_11030 [Lepagella muris]